MAINKQKKIEILTRMQGIVKNTSTLVFANFKGLSVAEQVELRKALRAQEVGYTVAKKTLIKRALSEAGFEGAPPELPGEIALAYGLPAQAGRAGKDELAPARELAVFVKKFPERLAFAGGVFAGRFVNVAEIKGIGAIPPMQTLRAQFVRVINSPLQKLAVVLGEMAKKQQA